MAQLIENSSPFNIQIILPFVEKTLKSKIEKNKSNFDCSKNGKIA